MTPEEFKTEAMAAVKARHPDLTEKQRGAIADSVIEEESANHAIHPLWEASADFRAEFLGYALNRIEREKPELFVPPPDAKAVYNALLAKLKAEITDPADPRHADQNDTRRNLWRQVSQLTPDQRAEAIKGLTLAPEAPAATREQVEQIAPKFSDPFSHEFEDYVHRRLGIAPHALGARKRQELFAFVNRTDPRATQDKNTLKVAETQAQTRTLSLAERREAARAQARLARKAG